MGVNVGSGSAVSTAANTKSANLITGTYENIGRGTITLAAKASATGMNCTLLVGGIPLINDQPIADTGTAGTLSSRDNEQISQLVSGGRVEFTLRNTTGGALTTDYRVSWNPQ